MKLPFHEDGKPAGTLLGPALAEALRELCDRRQMVLLATPYLHYESRFLEMDGRELRIRATMGRDAVKHVLGQHPLRLRFPWELVFYSGPTRILRYVQEEGQRHLCIEVPPHAVVDERRRAFRVERVGRSRGAVGCGNGTILAVSLESVSPLGASVFCLEPVPSEQFRPSQLLDLSLSLEGGGSLTCGARISHRDEQKLGLAFHPPLEGRTLQRLSEWLAPREQEAKRRWENRAELRARAAQLARPRALPEGLLLVSARTELQEQIASALEGAWPLRITPPAMAPFKEALATPPLLLLVDAAPGGLETRRRLRAMLESHPVEAPIVVLGRAEDPQDARLLASELKASATLEWHGRQGVFFRRLMQGLIQQHRKES